MTGQVVLSPWDQAPYFQPVVERSITSAGIPTQLLDANPMRIAAIVSNVGATDVYLSTVAGVQGTNGIHLAPNAVPFLLTHKDYGVLVQVQWYWYGVSPSGTVRVIEVLLAKWPGQS